MAVTTPQMMTSPTKPVNPPLYIEAAKPLTDQEKIEQARILGMCKLGVAPNSPLCKYPLSNPTLDNKVDTYQKAIDAGNNSLDAAARAGKIKDAMNDGIKEGNFDDYLEDVDTY